MHGRPSLALVLFGACAAAPSGAPAQTTSTSAALPIPARAQAAESPPSGWCGETAIQEGLLYLGMWAPQRSINRAGRPVHPDLYANEIPAALTALGVRFTPYVARARGYDAFAKWAARAIDDGHPVLAGVKILPTQHPDWGLDHFVLVVGHGSDGLLVNTTWGHRAWVGDTTTPGLSFRNAFYGLRLDGLVAPAGGSASARPARITLLAEGDATMRTSVSCEGLRAGSRGRIEQRSWPSPSLESSLEVTADATGHAAAEVLVASSRFARFQCVFDD
ncbi:MAG: hypothetical protein JST00_39620 [Deltaproteobacteria bacterium]|nr:hypothetical protein [Deltaproteobacteria bacterium]